MAASGYEQQLGIEAVTALITGLAAATGQTFEQAARSLSFVIDVVLQEQGHMAAEAEVLS